MPPTTRLAGRQAELDRRASAIDTSRGRSGVLLEVAAEAISGAAGIGKTRLAEEAAAAARVRDADGRGLPAGHRHRL
jgi:hypothetical protein